MTERTCRVLTILPIVWKQKPQSIKCFLCCEKPAVYRHTMEADKAIVNTCLCEDCIAAEPHEILNSLSARKKDRRAA